LLRIETGNDHKKHLYSTSMQEILNTVVWQA
jgi:hypothetical protein